MGTRTSHPPGTFSWVDLATTDTEAAGAFYAELFGWAPEALDTGGEAPYTLFRLAGDAVAGLFTLPEELRADGVPPNWTSHVTVDDADAAAAKAAELGGAVLREAFDATEAGRLAVLEDPQGAVFAVWQPGTQIGAERVNDVGCLCMNELATTDLDGARDFYSALFGWTTEAVDTGPDGPSMTAVFNQGTLNANLTTVDGAPPHWRPYFTVASAEATLGRIAELGGQVVLGPLPIPDGSIGMALDPQGALFGLFEGEVDP